MQYGLLRRLGRSSSGTRLVISSFGLSILLVPISPRARGAVHFKTIADLSGLPEDPLYETQHWLRRAYKRGLLQSEDITKLKTLIEELGPRLNAYLTSIGPKHSVPKDK